MRYGALLFAFTLGCSSGRSHINSNDAGSTDLAGGGSNGCSASAKLVYVVDTNNQVSSFDPSALAFADVGLLSCPAMPGATPFSMAVDRNAIAWVLYNSGELFRFDTQGKTCQATAFAQSNGFGNFGMGFSTDAAGSTAETLFIAGGAVGSVGGGSSTLATLDLTTMVATPRGTIALWPELTGTGAAELWGFFPDAVMPKVSKLDKSTGADVKTFPATTLAGMPMSWAFAFWGGDFWIFLERQGDGSTFVYRLHGSTGAIDTVLPSTGRHIVGAGVSTCAPITIQ